MAEGTTSTDCDFFISYTKADEAWAAWIAWVLEEANYRVLVQAWDFVPGSNWTHLMDQGVQSCQRTIAVVSPAYRTSVYGTAEWQAVWGTDPTGAQRKLIPVRVGDGWLPGLISGVVGIDLLGLAEDQAKQRLLDGVATALAGRAKPAMAPPFPSGNRSDSTPPLFPGAGPAVFTVPPRNPNFTGRGAELDQIHTALTSGTTMTVQAVHGLAGVGKSQTVIEYGHRHATEYDLVWWINAEQPTLITDQIAALAGPLGLRTDLPPGETVRAVYAALRNRPDWLLVFDNAESPADLQPLLPSGPGHVLITTRRGGFSFLGSVLDMDVLPRDQATALLQHRVPSLSDEEANELADLLGDLPLALEQAAGYLDQTQLPAAEYLELLRTRAPDMLRRGRVVDHTGTVATLWSLTLDHLRASEPATVQLATICAYLAPEPIPLHLFTGRVSGQPCRRVARPGPASRGPTAE